MYSALQVQERTALQKVEQGFSYLPLRSQSWLQSGKSSERSGELTQDLLTSVQRRS